MPPFRPAVRWRAGWQDGFHSPELAASITLIINRSVTLQTAKSFAGKKKSKESPKTSFHSPAGSPGKKCRARTTGNASLTHLAVAAREIKPSILVDVFLENLLFLFFFLFFPPEP